jgi:phosphatidylserine/phosphatidylglycerophosphate/cardiolipin synthase-like enzyme
MFQKDIVAPIVLTETCEVRLTTPWFVEDSEYPPALASYRPLVNGEEAFAAVHHAIAQAKKSVDIICWGFQPSMYFIRDGKSPCIGELLCQIAEKGVQVRILGWEMPFNTAGFAGEANLPGKGAIRFRDRAGQSASEEQYAFDKKWFRKYAYTGEPADMILGNISIVGEAAQNYMRNTKLRASSPLFVSRGFNQYERAEIAYRLAREATDQEISGAAISTMTFSATHHQKTVLVDYELPEHAVGFVMGHNMIDEYWDTDAHSAQNRRADSAPAPNKGARGFLPRQDISCQVTGPILEHLHHNFALSWLRETRQNLFLLRNAKENAKKLKLQEGYGKPLMAQLLRTQAQEEKRDIEKLYLQSVNNATRFIYIENQYFRWPPLAEAIKKAALAQMKNGRTPERDGSLYLFVTTNVTDDGIGAGTVNTQRMLDALGQGGAIPEIHKLRRVKQLQEELERERDAALLNEPCIALNPWDPAAIEKVKERGAEIKRKLGQLSEGN